MCVCVSVVMSVCVKDDFSPSNAHSVLQRPPGIVGLCLHVHVSMAQICPPTQIFSCFSFSVF